jgi:hypothetical protein
MLGPAASAEEITADSFLAQDMLDAMESRNCNVPSPEGRNHNHVMLLESEKIVKRLLPTPQMFALDEREGRLHRRAGCGLAKDHARSDLLSPQTLPR